MTLEGLIVPLIALASFAGYYWLGIRLVVRPYVTRALEQELHEFDILYRDDPNRLAKERRDRAAEALILNVIWPFLFLASRATRAIAASAPLCTAEAELLLKQRNRRIAELERELEGR